MRDIIRWLLSQLENSDIEEATKETAVKRLQLVLIQDRLDMPADKMDAMKQEILEVVSRYLVVEDEFMEFEIRKLDELVVLVANIEVKELNEVASAV
ncbi:MAG: cell division topological specificity factor MinE [Chloroflexi bacterium]|nr:cell division topological specificity factor MinE [Chloroflexota bacterium]MCH8349267.1 cell division topological specificity factor MinE [Chloroflexota bacterium]MCI0780113.1 cell division topological specificity factor MinE [Chloroflexota bacterium]MCI0785100.1 cell division topological specificity factor MinE [Chloroflexota bacterium]MCI0793313.1 cell division topological specificity factor MinE [Chloroflexota bacterium]